MKVEGCKKDTLSASDTSASNGACVGAWAGAGDGAEVGAGASNGGGASVGVDKDIGTRVDVCASPTTSSIVSKTTSNLDLAYEVGSVGLFNLDVFGLVATSFVGVDNPWRISTIGRSKNSSMSSEISKILSNNIGYRKGTKLRPAIRTFILSRIFSILAE